MYSAPFDVVRRLGDEESLRVAVEFELVSGVDGDVGLRAVLITTFDSDQQQTQLDETEPAHTATQCTYHTSLLPPRYPTHSEYLLVFIAEQNLVGISAVIRLSCSVVAQNCT